MCNHKVTESSMYFTETFYKCIKHRYIDECSTCVPYIFFKQFSTMVKSIIQSTKINAEYPCKVTHCQWSP